MRTSSQRAGIFAVLGAALCFGTTGTTQQLGVADISPVAVASARLICGSLFLLIYLVSRRSSEINYRMPTLDLLISGAGIAMYQLTFFSAVHLTGIAISTVTALGAAPTFSALVAFLILGEKPQRSWYLGTAVTIFGIILVGTANGISGFSAAGVGLAALAGFGFAVFNVLCRKSLERGASDLSVTYILFMYGLKRISSSMAATVVLAEPATATLLAALVIGEPLVAQSYIGVVTVAVGILYISKKK
ncbi:MAG: hypothetical protein RL560_941 [Actinomycetota bacterium]